MTEFYKLSIEQALKQLKSSREGLTTSQAKSRIKTYNYNEILKTKHFSKIKIFLRQFLDPLVIILVLAVVLSALIPIFKNGGNLELHEMYDSLFIGVILLLNAILGFVQEFKAEKSVELLKKLSVPKSNVLRDRKLVKIASKELVPGDVILLDAGDRISADARILEYNNLRVDESALTGESSPVTENNDTINKTVTLADQSNILFSGTLVTEGTAKALVYSTGMNTEIGKIASLVQDVKETKTPLQKRLATLGKYLGLGIVLISLIIVTVGVLNSQPLAEMLLIGVSLAVSAIPEGLPAVITVALALSVNSMVKKKALVKQLKAIETLGNVSVIATDKTGTLTKNEMTVSELFVNNKTIKVSGSGFSTKGFFFENNKKVSTNKFKLLLEIGASCNNATLPNIGDPTEIALLVSAAKAKINKNNDRTNETPFDSIKKYMITEHKDISYIKGAPEALLKLCKYYKLNNKIIPLTSQHKKSILNKNEEMASSALRVLAMAYKENQKIIFVGLQGMIDQPRKEVAPAIKLCEKAGIRVLMITGDHKLTAQAIAKKVGIEGRAIEGKDLDKLTDKQLKATLKEVSVIARSTPENKVRILNVLQKNKEVVAMTGDGINDAPALKKADVGIAMAIKGTDIARDASDMVLLNDNFSSIVHAIHHGRTVYENIKKFIKYILSVNLSEVLLILTAIFLKFPLPLLPLQILWINLATDGLPALALSVEKSEKDIMRKKPKSPSESVFKGIKKHILFGTLIVFTASLTAFLLYLDDLTKARTMALTVSILFQLFFVFTCRSEQSLLKIGFFSNRKLVYAVLGTVLIHLVLMYTKVNTIFSMTPLGLNDWIKVIILASSGLIIFEVYKLTKNIKPKRLSL
jgi:P-type Ca2+ transporter type 2C